MKQDPLSDALSAINNAVQQDREYAKIEPATETIKQVLIQLQRLDYIGVFELIEDGQGDKFRVEVTNNLNQCRPIKPNFPTQVDEYDKWAKRYLPARNFGHLIVTTPKGIKTHEQALEENHGGKLLGYVY